MEDTIFRFLFCGETITSLIVHLTFFTNRGKRNNKQDSEKLGVGYHKNNNKIAVPDMIDGLTVVADIEEENRCDL